MILGVWAWFNPYPYSIHTELSIDILFMIVFWFQEVDLVFRDLSLVMQFQLSNCMLSWLNSDFEEVNFCEVKGLSLR